MGGVRTGGILAQRVRSSEIRSGRIRGACACTRSATRSGTQHANVKPEEPTEPISIGLPLYTNTDVC